MPETKVPALADPVTVKDPQLKRVLASYKEALEIRLGRRGDKLDRAVTLRELIQAGIAKIGPGGSFSGEEIEFPEVYDGSEDLGTTPTAPTGFTAAGGFATVVLQWDEPYKAYKNHAYTEIWRAPVDNLGEAILVGVSSDFMYSDPVGTGGTFYYWARFVSQASIAGPYNGTAGTMAETAIPADQIKQELLNSLGYEHFNVADGSFPIKLVDVLPPLPDSRFPEGAYVSLLPGAILYRNNGGVAWNQVVNANDMTGQITTGQIATNSITSGKIVSGAIIADKIAVGAVVADKIAANAITSAKIVAGAVTADKISVSSLSAVSANLGTIQVGSANIENGSITNAKIANAAIDNAKIANAAINNAKIADLSVTNAKIANASIDNAKIANAAITNAKIANAAIGTANIQDLSISGQKLDAYLVVEGTTSIGRYGSVTIWTRPGRRPMVTVTGNGGFTSVDVVSITVGIGSFTLSNSFDTAVNVRYFYI